MKEPLLVIMAAGMGSRYGGLKQIDPIDEEGNIIIDYSIYDAKKAGFKKILFIITKSIEEEFKKKIGMRIAKQMEVLYAFQDMNTIPKEFTVPENRMKPWGTGHAVLSCEGLIDAPFGVINADDFYGAQSFKLLYEFLKNYADKLSPEYMMVGYYLKNTVTKYGAVARGICSIDNNNHLQSITERTHIEKRKEDIAYLLDGSNTYISIEKDSVVSMNMWGFGESFMIELKNRFSDYLKKIMKDNPEKGEYFLPSVVNDLLCEKKASVLVKESPDKWYGMTYKKDKETVVAAIKEMKKIGLYNNRLWEE